MGLLSNPWIHPFGAILREFFIVAPHVRIVVVQLGEEIMQLRRIFCLQRANHSCFQEFAEGVGFFHGGQEAQSTTDLVLVHHRSSKSQSKARRENSEPTDQNASVSGDLSRYVVLLGSRFQENAESVE